MRLFTALAVFVLATAFTAAAQQRAATPSFTAADDPAKKPTPKLPDGHPDLNGYWAASRGPDTPVNSEFGQRSAFIKRGDWRNAKEAYADPNQPPYINCWPERLTKSSTRFAAFRIERGRKGLPNGRFGR